jgi:hypothetical protein
VNGAPNGLQIRPISKLNDVFWAAYYSQGREKIIFEPAEKKFYDYSSRHGIFDSKSEDIIRTELNALVLDAARNWDGYAGIDSFRNAENSAELFCICEG